MDEKEKQFIETVSKGLKLLGLHKLNDEEEIKLLRRLREVNSI
jgi:ribosomal protein L30/L7E